MDWLLHPRRRILADRAAFDAVRAGRQDHADPVVARQLDVLHDEMVPNQISDDLQRQIVELETDVEATFTSFRGELDGERVGDNAILDVLRTSDDSGLRRRAWEASKQVGGAVGGSVRELARLRNAAAGELGYRDHFALALAVGEMDEARLLATLDEVDRHIMQLEIELQSLGEDNDPGTAARREQLERALAEESERSAAMHAEWQREKAATDAVADLQAKLDAALASMKDGTLTTCPADCGAPPK